MPSGVHLSSERRVLLYRLFVQQNWTADQVFTTIFSADAHAISLEYLTKLRNLFVNWSDDKVAAYLSASAKRGAHAASINILVDALVDGFVAVYPSRSVAFIRHLVNTSISENYGSTSEGAIKESMHRQKLNVKQMSYISQLPTLSVFTWKCCNTFVATKYLISMQQVVPKKSTTLH